MQPTVPLPEKHMAEHRARRRFVLPGKRLPGLLALLVLPALALGGLTALRGQAMASGESLQVRVDYPRVLRYLKPAGLQITILNTADLPVTDVTVGLDRSYLSAFTGLTIMPAETNVTAHLLEVHAGTVQPGQTVHLRLELRANDYWYQRGHVRVSGSGGQFHLPIGTLMLP